MFDHNQSVMPGDIPTSAVKELSATRFQLSSQLRVQGGEDYIEYIDAILNTSNPQLQSFSNYDIRLLDSGSDLIDLIKEHDSNIGLSRVVAGYGWDWKTKSGDQHFDIEIDGLKLIWNSTNTDWVNSPNAINEVGCIHTVQGYDLNYAGVILGPEIDFDPIIGQIVIDQSKYRDLNGKRSVESPDELTLYIRNIYKTLLTRGIKGTYIYAYNKNLRNYLKKYF